MFKVCRADVSSRAGEREHGRHEHDEPCPRGGGCTRCHARHTQRMQLTLRAQVPRYLETLEHTTIYGMCNINLN